METMETQVKNVIEKIRPYIQRDGGDVEFVSLEDGIPRFEECVLPPQSPQ